MSLLQISVPAAEPVTLAEARLHLRIDADNTSDDALISGCIQAARELAEQELQRAIVTQTWELVLDGFPACEIEIPKPAVQSISSVKYIDSAQVEQTLDASRYSLDAQTLRGWLLPAYDTDWPTDVLDSTQVVRIRFVCGYGAAAQVPESVKCWILLQVGALYRNREAFVQGQSVAELPNRFTDWLLDGHRVHTVL